MFSNLNNSRRVCGAGDRIVKPNASSKKKNYVLGFVHGYMKLDE
jgi:hypothetical protein